MKIRNYMITSPITINEDETISEALDIFKRNSFHRLPVVDSAKRFIELITEGVIAANTPTSATSLSIYELNYLLSKTKVKDIMIKEPIVADQEMLLEEAADLMRRKNVGCLPIVDESKLIGIITKNDIFKAFVEMLGYYASGSRLVVEVDVDRPGILKDIATVLSNEGISISHLVVYRDEKVNIIIRVEDTDGEKIKNLLTNVGYKVTEVKISK